MSARGGEYGRADGQATAVLCIGPKSHLQSAAAAWMGWVEGEGGGEREPMTKRGSYSHSVG